MFVGSYNEAEDSVERNYREVNASDTNLSQIDTKIGQLKYDNFKYYDSLFLRVRQTHN